MTLSRREFLFGLLGSALTACGAANREPDFTVVIDRSHQFDPASLTIPAGSLVAWQHRAETVHTVTADPAKAQMPGRVTLPSEAEPFDSGDLHSGERWVYSFDIPGTYVYFCRYHERDEMIGVIQVMSAER